MSLSSVTLCTSVGPILFNGLNSAQELGVDIAEGQMITEALKLAWGHTTSLMVDTRSCDLSRWHSSQGGQGWVALQLYHLPSCVGMRAHKELCECHTGKSSSH